MELCGEIKDAFCALAKMTAAHGEAVCVVTACEAWMVSAPDPELLGTGKSIANHPRRESIVFVLFEHAKWKTMAFAPAEGGVVGEWQIVAGAEAAETQGRFIGLLGLS